MNPVLSVYLDLIRFTAAFVVFAGHVSGARFTGGFLWQFGAYMGSAVAIFFVLSGFVIGHVQQSRETGARDYAIARTARILSVALPAILLTMLLDPIGRWWAPGAYSAAWGYTADNTPLQVLAALTFMQKSFGADLSLGSDLPYWSLNYEVFYYLLFGLAVFCRPRWLAFGLILAAGMVGGVAILSLFPLWLLGYAAIRVRPWRYMSGRGGWALILLSVAAAGAYERWSQGNARWLAGIGPAFRPEIAQDYLVAVLFLASLVGVTAASADLAWVAARARRPVGWLASQTFSLYLYHLPIAQFLSAVNPWPPAQWQSRALLGLGTLGLVCLLAQVTERRKRFWRALVAAAFAGVTGIVRRAA